jgi:undecaprenyl-diphosphatase
MPLTHVIVLAVVQGVTELLPISSSAHLALMPWLLGWPDQGLTFDVALHMGTLLAVVAYFGRQWWDILFHDRRMLGYLVLATIPAGVAGLFLQKYVETIFRSPLIMGANLILVGLLMWWAERVARNLHPMEQLTFKDAMAIGGAQALALVPGVSRSGITITTGLFRGLKRDAAARFSFLLSTPIIAGAGLKKALDLRHIGIAPDMQVPFLLGVVIAGATGYAVIAFLMRYLQTRTLKIFVYYRVTFGIIILVLAILARPR